VDKLEWVETGVCLNISSENNTKAGELTKSIRFYVSKSNN